MQGGTTPGRNLGMDEMSGPRAMQYICGECHQEQEIKPKVKNDILFYNKFFSPLISSNSKLRFKPPILIKTFNFKVEFSLQNLTAKLKVSFYFYFNPSISNLTSLF